MPYGWDWPSGVPRSYDQMVYDWGEYVMKAVAKYNKVDRNLKELLQEVWSKIIGSQLLERFIDGAARRLPAEMTASEVCLYLGITFEQWAHALRSKPWLARPLKGKRTSKYAVFSTHSILNIDDMAHKLWLKRPVFRMRPRITACGFKAYLTRAIHNHFANWCRTRSRKYKEQLLTPTSALIRQTDGCCRQVADLEDLAGGWEANIAAAMTLDEEDLIDLVNIIRKANVNPDTPEGVEVLDFMIQQGKSCEDGPRRNVELLELLGEGYTLAEAAKKVHQIARLRVRVAVTA